MLCNRMTITILNLAYQSLSILHMYMYKYVGLPHIYYPLIQNKYLKGLSAARGSEQFVSRSAIKSYH